MNYYDFLKSKIKMAPDDGFNIDTGELSPVLKPHERDSALWMVRGGRRALFSSFGLGKTITQLEVMRVILNHEKGKDGVKYLQAIEREIAAPTLFDMEEVINANEMLNIS